MFPIKKSLMASIRYFFVLSFLFIVSFVKAEYFVISDYNIDIKVYGSKAMFEVTEIITVDFSEPRRGIFRNIPYQVRVGGEIVELDIYDVDVEGFKYDTYREGSQYVIKIGDKNVYVEGRQTYKITYKVKNAWIFAEEHTEFYWNFVGDQWPVEIKSIKYAVTLDESLPMSETDYSVYTGVRGSKGKDADINYYVNKFNGKSTRSFGPNEGLTFAIKLPKGYIKEPSDLEKLWAKYGLACIGGILFSIITGLFYRTWSRYGKDYPIVKMVQYTIPKDINPAEAGVIIDEKADNVDILALLPYWAHNGILQIRRIPKTWGKDDHELIKIAELPAESGPYEKIVFDGLFASSDKVLVSSLENEFYQTLQTAKTSLKTHLNSMGVYYPVSVKMQFYTGVVSFILAVAAIGLGVAFQSIALGAALGLSSIIGFIFSNYMLKKNERGVQLYQQVLGFKMFVKAAEKDKLEWLLKEDPDYFEKTLPYAMIFGYAKQWSKKFDGLTVPAPKWYVGPTGMYYHGSSFSPSEFGASFDSSIHDIQSVFISVPASSGGGGSFSGGGSSGGGFGGGGGGSW